jgi:hypothetical protein
MILKVMLRTGFGRPIATCYLQIATLESGVGVRTGWWVTPEGERFCAEAEVLPDPPDEAA